MSTEETFVEHQRAVELRWEWTEGDTRRSLEIDLQTIKWLNAPVGDALAWGKSFRRKPGRTPDHPRYNLELWREEFVAELHIDPATGDIKISDDELRRMGMAWFLKLQQMAARVVELLRKR